MTVPVDTIFTVNRMRQICRSLNGPPINRQRRVNFELTTGSRLSAIHIIEGGLVLIGEVTSDVSMLMHLSTVGFSSSGSLD